MSQTRARILEVARELYIEEGAEVSMRKIATRVGVSATAIYRHFEDKEALLMGVCAQGFEQFGAYLMRGLTGSGPGDRLERTISGYTAFAIEHPSFYRIMFTSPFPGWDRLRASRAESFAPTFHFLVDRVAECQRASILGAGDPTHIARSMWAHQHGLITLWLDGHVALEAPESDLLAHHQTLVEGLRFTP